MQRFWSKVEKTPDGCWLWTASTNADGYGWFRHGDRPHLAHRIAWLLTHGALPTSVIDHECHNQAARAGTCTGGKTCIHRRCVNPEHLRDTTRASNAAASALVLTTQNAAKTHCVNDHPLSGSNLAIRDGGKRRRCLTCARNAKNKSMARLRAGER